MNITRSIDFCQAPDNFFRKISGFARAGRLFVFLIASYYNECIDYHRKIAQHSDESGHMIFSRKFGVSLRGI